MEEQIEQLVSLYCSPDTANHALADTLLEGMPDLEKAFWQYIENEYGWCKPFVGNSLSLGKLWFTTFELGIFKQCKWGKFPPNIKSVIANNHSKLFELPDTVESLSLNGNNLTESFNLPVNLKKLKCYRNLFSVSPKLPIGLKKLSWNYTWQCDDKSIVFPELPAGLQELVCDEWRLKTLPIGLKKLCLSSKKLTALPKLPAGLEVLHCGRSKIIELPELPEKLIELVCYCNPLIALPKLPTSLKSLVVSDDQRKLVPKKLRAKFRHPSSQLFYFN